MCREPDRHLETAGCSNGSAASAVVWNVTGIVKVLVPCDRVAIFITVLDASLLLRDLSELTVCCE